MNNEMYTLLVSLAQRRTPGTKRWYSNPRHYIGDCGTCNCLICGEEIYLTKMLGGGYIFAPIVSHGEQHLKESNLLPFI